MSSSSDFSSKYSIKNAGGFLLITIIIIALGFFFNSMKDGKTNDGSKGAKITVICGGIFLFIFNVVPLILNLAKKEKAAVNTLMAGYSSVGCFAAVIAIVAAFMST
jgi:hypothetical protein